MVLRITLITPFLKQVIMREKYRKANVIYKSLKKGNDLLNHVITNTRLLLFIFVLGIAILLIIERYQRMFFTIFLIGLGAVSMIYQRYFRWSHYVGFELCMMATVLTGLAYGPHYGAFTGFVSISSALILSGNFKHSSFISILVLPLIGAIVPFFSSLSLISLGLLMTILYDVIILPLYVMLGSRISSSVIFFITHVLLNLWVFSTIAPIIYSLMH